MKQESVNFITVRNAGLRTDWIPVWSKTPMKKLVGWSMWAAPSLQIHPSNSSCATHHVGRSEYFKYDCIIEILLSVGRMQNQRALDFFNCFISSKVDAIMPKTRLAFTLLFAAALSILAGCTTMHYDFKAPDTDQGRYCVTQCAGIKEACNGNEIHRANSEKTSCERSNDTVYMACMGKSANKEQEKECEKHRKYCWSNPDSDRCDGDYRMCFVNCGGSIHQYEL